MNVLLVGATGMIGNGVLHECLADQRIASVLAVTRSPLGLTHGKLREARRADVFDLADLGPELRSVDACFFCLGVSSAGHLNPHHHTKYRDTLWSRASSRWSMSSKRRSIVSNRR
jgi:putative NADH-flavin reductase